jgi:hypothetical protein
MEYLNKSPQQQRQQLGVRLVTLFLEEYDAATVHVDESTVGFSPIVSFPLWSLAGL